MFRRIARPPKSSDAPNENTLEYPEGLWTAATAAFKLDPKASLSPIHKESGPLHENTGIPERIELAEQTSASYPNHWNLLEIVKMLRRLFRAPFGNETTLLRSRPTNSFDTMTTQANQHQRQKLSPQATPKDNLGAYWAIWNSLHVHSKRFRKVWY
ncbi:MAG: hypothetical protein AAGD22_11685 [Verrucomicrobiota bacterium]